MLRRAAEERKLKKKSAAKWPPRLSEAGRLAGHGPPKVRYAVAAVLCYYRASMMINISAAAVPSALCRQQEEGNKLI